MQNKQKIEFYNLNISLLLLFETLVYFVTDYLICFLLRQNSFLFAYGRMFPLTFRLSDGTKIKSTNTSFVIGIKLHESVFI